MAKLVYGEKSIDVGEALSATAGVIPLITLVESAAEALDVNIYGPNWGGPLVDPIKATEPPLTVNLNNLRLPPGKYQVEFKPSKAGAYLGTDRKSFMLTLKEGSMLTKGLNITNLGTIAFAAEQIIQTPTGPVEFYPWLQGMGVIELRFWLENTGRPTTEDLTRFFGRVAKFAAAGFHCTICLASKNWAGLSLPSEKSAQGSAYQLIAAAAKAGIPAEKLTWEISNEPENMPGTYWPGNFKQLVDLLANPMYVLFHGAGYQVISPACTGDATGAKAAALFAAGLHADIIGAHPYRTDAASLKPLMDGLLGIPGNRPLNLSEFNAYLGGNYRSSVDPKNSHGAKPEKFKAPARDGAYVLAVQHAQFVMLQGYAAKRPMTVSYYTDVQQWTTSTGPLGLLQVSTVAGGKIGSVKTTPFADQFWAKEAA